MRRIIGVAGYARSGKDEVCRALERRGFRLTRFSDVLKAEVLYRMPRTLTAIAGLLCIPEPGNPNTHHRMVHVLKPAPIRCLLQEYGTEVRRKDNPDYWCDRWEASLSATGDVSIADVRFPNEAATVRALGGRIWRVVRPGVGPLSDHASERQDFAVDRYIHNDGTLADLDAEVDVILEDTF